MISQLVFNSLIRPNVGGLYYRFLFKVRAIILNICPNVIIEYGYKNFQLKFPFSHDYPLNKKIIPQYSENLGIIAKIVNQKYSNSPVVDVGANVGDSAAIISSYCYIPILCIEGNPKFISLLEANVKQFPNVVIERSFVGEINETVNTINYGGTARVEKAETGIEVKTVDEILDKNPNFKKAKLFKTDTDGFDFKILRASENFLKESRPIVFFEYDPYFLELQKEVPINMFSFLKKLNYTNLLLFDNQGKFLCEVNTSQEEMLKDFTFYFNQLGSSYLDICAIHQDDLDLVKEIKSEFQK